MSLSKYVLEQYSIQSNRLTKGILKSNMATINDEFGTEESFIIGKTFYVLSHETDENFRRHWRLFSCPVSCVGSRRIKLDQETKRGEMSGP